MPAIRQPMPSNVPDHAGEAAPQPPRLILLGQPRWSAAGGRGAALIPKDAALLARLALDGPQARAVLAGWLWPDFPQLQAENSLRQRISRLNRAAGQALVLGGEIYRLAPAVLVDTQALAQLESHALLQTGDLLAGVDGGDLDALDRWLSLARDRMRDSLATELARRADGCEQQGQLEAAQALAIHIVSLLPLAEHGWRRVMRLHYLRDDRGAAQAAFWRLHALLREELGIRPSAETMALLQTIETADAQPAGLPRPVPVSLLRPPRLVGRQGAWQAMADAWQRRQPFLLVADAGLGKSRLLGDFLHGRDAVLRLGGRPGDEQLPYALLGRVLHQVDQRFRPGLAPALRGALDRLPPESGMAQGPVGHGPLIWQAMQTLLASAIPLGLQGLVLDDLHHADDASVEALRWLTSDPALAALPVGLATRPHARLATGGLLQHWLASSHRPARIDLAPLDLASLGELLDCLGLPLALDATLVRRLHRHAGGHPLFTLATLQDMIVRGLDPQAQAWPQPGTVQALIEQNLAALPAGVQPLLRAAAVAGADLTTERAAMLLRCDLDALVAPWSQLEQAHVLQGEAFSHDLMQECALRMVPRGVRQALHRQVAALLDAETPRAPARIAWHWEQGERWPEAAACWREAAHAAGLAGRLGEHINLLEKVAQLHRQAGDALACADALIDRLDALRMRQGGRAVLAALQAPELRGLSGWRQCRCRLARLEALLDGGEGAAEADEAAALVREAGHHRHGQAKAAALQAQALAQGGRFAEALAVMDQALAVADRPADRLALLHACSYVHYTAGRLRDAVHWQQQAVDQAEAIGDLGMAAVCEGHVAALLAAVGDVPGSHAHARRVQPQHVHIELSANSTPGIVNHIVRGSAAAALGRFDEALQCLEAALAMAAADAAPAAQAKSRLAMAQVQLALGRAAEAAALVQALPQAIGHGMQMQAHWVRGCAALQQQADATPHWRSLLALAQVHDQLPLVQSAWFEWSFAADAQAVLDRLPGVITLAVDQGLAGTARALQWRLLARALELPGPAPGLAAQAKALHSHVGQGLSAKCHPPAVWLTLADAYARAGAPTERAEALASARDWLHQALPSVPPAYRAGFEGSAVWRRLFGNSQPV